MHSFGVAKKIEPCSSADILNSNWCNLSLFAAPNPGRCLRMPTSAGRHSTCCKVYQQKRPTILNFLNDDVSFVFRIPIFILVILQHNTMSALGDVTEETVIYIRKNTSVMIHKDMYLLPPPMLSQKHTQCQHGYAHFLYSHSAKKAFVIQRNLYIKREENLVWRKMIRHDEKKRVSSINAIQKQFKVLSSRYIVCSLEELQDLTLQSNNFIAQV